MTIHTVSQVVLAVAVWSTPVTTALAVTAVAATLVCGGLLIAAETIQHANPRNDRVGAA